MRGLGEVGPQGVQQRENQANRTVRRRVGPQGTQRRGKSRKKIRSGDGTDGGAGSDLPAEAGSKVAPCYRAAAAITGGEGGSGSWEEGGLDV
ncbi:hypothetical protein NDU88_001047 [Pleurodeles waltl]|uniref:Uncharacterized protein n=1 Tax=Pleurodeles waltl TaxID=8319 RepID=A0AAV7V8Z3_PLEWA|nr:hypothetical protein NDU88_001047 [Pleurodeles waltl]